jgi:hypothetical protein
VFDITGDFTPALAGLALLLARVLSGYFSWLSLLPRRLKRLNPASFFSSSD